MLRFVTDVDGVFTKSGTHSHLQKLEEWLVESVNKLAQKTRLEVDREAVILATPMMIA